MRNQVITCERCGKVFRVPLSRGPNVRFCGRACYISPTKACACCGATFSTAHSEKFCSRACYHRGRVAPVAERFWPKVRKTEGCWLWEGGMNGDYGAFDNTSAHHMAWVLTHGEVPEGQEVCHNCPGGDNPRCVNPAHMFLGTRRDNMQDAVRKGRVRRGERHGCARLTAEQVLDIRARYAAGGVSHEALASEFGVSRPTVSLIISRKNWGWL